jgi:hypothetical protein
MGLRPTQGDEKRLGPATTLYEPSPSPCHPERSRISYFTALTSNHLCGSPQREPHALDRSRNSRQEIRGSRGICGSADLSWKCFSTERPETLFVGRCADRQFTDKPTVVTNRLFQNIVSTAERRNWRGFPQREPDGGGADTREPMLIRLSICGTISLSLTARSMKGTCHHFSVTSNCQLPDCRLLAQNPSNVKPGAGSSTHFMPRLPMVDSLLPESKATT